MQLKALFISGLAATAFAAENTIKPSDLPALISALPSSAFAYISEHGSKAFSSHVASEFRAGETPGWFTKLPPKVQSDLLGGSAKNASASLSIGSSSAPVNATITKSSTTITTPLSSVINSLSSALAPGKGSTSPGASASAASASSSSTSNGAAPLPTAVVGAGLGAIAGIVGLLAL